MYITGRPRPSCFKNNKNVNTSTMAWYEHIGSVPKPARTGILVVLNGPSSAGKSSIAKELQEIIFHYTHKPFLHYSTDDFLAMTAPQLLKDEKLLVEYTPQYILAFNDTIPPLLEHGLNVILDHVLLEWWWAMHLQETTDRYKTIYVSIDAPLEVLEARERERVDRTVGIARYEKERVHHAFLPYVVSIDTSMGSPAEHARTIFYHLLRVFHFSF